MSAEMASRRRDLKGDLEAGCRCKGLEEVFKGGSRCRLEENFLIKGGAKMSAGRSRRGFHRGAETMQSCGLFWL